MCSIFNSIKLTLSSLNYQAQAYVKLEYTLISILDLLGLSKNWMKKLWRKQNMISRPPQTI